MIVFLSFDCCATDLVIRLQGFSLETASTAKQSFYASVYSATSDGSLIASMKTNHSRLNSDDHIRTWIALLSTSNFLCFLCVLICHRALSELTHFFIDSGRVSRTIHESTRDEPLTDYSSTVVIESGRFVLDPDDDRIGSPRYFVATAHIPCSISWS